MATFRPTEDSYELLEKNFLKSLFLNETVADEVAKALIILPFEEREATIQVLSSRAGIHSAHWRERIKAFGKK